MKAGKVFLFALSFASLVACSTSATPVSLQTCDVVDGNVYPPGNQPSYAHLALTNISDETATNIVVFVTYSNSSYGFPIHVQQHLERQQKLSLTYRLSNDENFDMIGGKWEYSCWLESVTFQNGRVWSGAVRAHWPTI
jgi:hypothetical protein